MPNKPSSIANYIYRMGASPNTRVAVTQKNKVYGYMVGQQSFQQIGAVSEFGWDESRTIEAVRGVGFGDQVAETVPSVTEPMTLTLNKTLMYAVNLMQVVGYKGGVEGLVRSLRHHRWPFDIKQELVFSDLVSSAEIGDLSGVSDTAVKNATSQPTSGAVAKALFTYYEACWFNSYSASFTSDAAIVAENGSVTVTDIIDGVSTYGEFIDSGLSPANAGGPGKGYSLRFAGGAQPTAVTT